MASVSRVANVNRRRFMKVAATAAAFPALLQVQAQHQEEGHWSYEGQEGPEYWGDIDGDFATCRQGQEQSPIDIVDAQDEGTPESEIAFDYQTLSPISLLNNGHTIQVLGSPESGMEIDGEWFELTQLHFHTPSEHRIAGELADMEVHFVHQSETEALAVMSILIKEGAQNAPLADVFLNLPAEEGPAQEIDGALELAAILPPDLSTFQYSGSLTTPPCTQGLQWFVMQAPIEMSAEQIAGFQAIYDMNARPLQPLNGRDIIEDETP